MTAHALPNYRWIKFPITCLNDWDFMHLTDAAAGMYVKLYLLAARCDSGGLLCSSHKAFDLEELAWQLRTDARSLEACISELIKAGMLKIEQDGTGSPASWMNRAPATMHSVRNGPSARGKAGPEH